MHKLAGLWVVAGVALSACVGEIENPEDGSFGTPGAAGNGKSGVAFVCDPAASELTPTPIRRLARTYVESAVRELLSTFDDETREELLAALRSRLDLIPLDHSESYSQNDDHISQDHVDAMFGLAVAAAFEVSNPSKPYASQLLKVCGDELDEIALADPDCLSKFIAHYGRKAFRRPLSEAERADFATFHQQAVAEGASGLAALIGRLIAHPRFYYRLDSDGELVDGSLGSGAVHRLSRWELLSKITFLFWMAPPTDDLYERVLVTDITRDEELDALVDDVLADPKAERGVAEFHREWLRLEETVATPATEGNVLAGKALIASAGLQALPATHREDMLQEVLELFRHYTFHTDGTLDDVLTSPYSFAKSPALAAIYGVDPWDGSPTNLVPLPAGERSGLISRAAFVASSSEYTSPIMKGLAIHTRLLCTPVPPPPPALKIEPLSHPAHRTTRQDVETATADPNCQTCHRGLNPLGFLSEKYDPLGRFRQKEARFELDSPDVAALLDVDSRAAAQIGDASPRELADAVELGVELASSGVVHSCMVRHYFEFVTGREENDVADGCELAELREKLAGPNGSIRAMLKHSVMQRAFRMRKSK